MIDNRYKHYYSLVLARTTQLRRYWGTSSFIAWAGEGVQEDFGFVTMKFT